LNAVVQGALRLFEARFQSAGVLAARDEAFERESILRELKLHASSMAETARALGLERSHLYKKCTQLGIDLENARKSP
jgi:DNA-binding NtrC family response regulator